MELKKIIEFARSCGYDSVIKKDSWKQFKVYEPLFNDDKIHHVGLPYFILVKNSHIRLSTVDESFQYIDDTYKDE